MLETLDLGRRLPRSRYERDFPKLRERLRRAQYALKEAEIPTIVVFEGWDGAGKSTAIQRLTQYLDPRAFRQYPGAPPSELELRYHFLWRFQTRLPEDGQMAFFDNSWYGRVLVERVEKLARKREWRRSYAQICEFERWLADDGQVLVKFFMHVSQKEQARRLRRMEKDPAESWKVGSNDWKRNKRYDKWRLAVEEMLAKTDSPHAPWTLVAAEDHRTARLAIFETLVARMEEALARQKAAPEARSRTAAAKNASRQSREKRARENRERVVAAARDAGLPLTED
jgi:AMP-polyphosphate phosphotransferase